MSRALSMLALAALGIEPAKIHLNEGHAAFAAVEMLASLRAKGMAHADAVAAVRARTVFTTHTPVPAGIDRFPREMIERFFGGDNAEPGMPVLVNELVKTGPNARATIAIAPEARGDRPPPRVTDVLFVEILVQ